MKKSIDNKADKDHTYEISYVTDLQEALDSLDEEAENSDDFISFIMTDLISSLIKNAVDGKPDTDHTHRHILEVISRI